MAKNGRIDAARRRLGSLKRTLALASVGVFALAAGVARAADTHATSSQQRTGTQVYSQDDGSSYWDGSSGSLAPAQGAPQAQAGVS